MPDNDDDDGLNPDDVQHVHYDDDDPATDELVDVYEYDGRSLDDYYEHHRTAFDNEYLLLDHDDNTWNNTTDNAEHRQ